jgi:hypothetical protein
MSDKKNLTTVAPVHFVSIVLFGIVGGGDHNTCTTSSISHSKGLYNRDKMFEFFDEKQEINEFDQNIGN